MTQKNKHNLRKQLLDNPKTKFRLALKEINDNLRSQQRQALEEILK